MATRFFDKEHGVDTSTAIADDATGTAKVKNLPDAAGVVYDRVDGFLKYNDAGNIRTVVNTNEAQTLTNKTSTSQVLTTPVIDGVTYSAANDRQLICEVVAIAGAALHAANLTLWTAPAAALIDRVVLNITTKSTGASTIDIGYTAVGATTTSDTLLDGIDSGTAIGVFDSADPTLDSGANAHAQLAASGKWITADEASGDTTGLVANIYIFYWLV